MLPREHNPNKRHFSILCSIPNLLITYLTSAAGSAALERVTCELVARERIPRRLLSHEALLPLVHLLPRPYVAREELVALRSVLRVERIVRRIVRVDGVAEPAAERTVARARIALRAIGAAELAEVDALAKAEPRIEVQTRRFVVRSVEADAVEVLEQRR